ncbi:tRNA uridine-5-carboxymethylaminomethyl(34) synthesis GTPase MnmE [Citreimonas salinaria]|uniref:tRNA modification GTPase MnmE n=1 Tax=Citreimonas salinaria TaxID=321339 RepID=A0A1H3FDF5_9RHOB|nr:tRNA uridine-5-carboxymethylaminomethyl(34) synthesis GTPase MnmE [Citreimonas salinaria]SDX88817.1 tRNA modification GTPase trmE [Citreimonas salinaria]
MDTIFALASAPGKAGLGVIRVSGPRADDACDALAGGRPEYRRASLRRLRDAEGGVLDEALVLRFDAGKSFTGEEVVEFHLHGSVAIIQAVLRRLGALDGFRMAEPGEFTRRALENGRMDLTQVEALADLIDSETESQRRQALDLLSGALSARVGRWRDATLRAVSLLEATIDFADEDVPVDVSPEVRALLTEVVEGIEAELSGLDAAERVRTGFQVAIIGPPNAGKSTLLNYLAGREAAITSEIAGTTRDVIEVRMDLGGLAVTLLDTAGLRETDDAVERIGVQRGRERAEAADLRVHLVTEDITPGVVPGPDDLVFRAKIDLVGGEGVSGTTGQGVPALVDAVKARLMDKAVQAGLASRERHRLALTAGASHLHAAIGLLDSGADLYELTSEEVRLALRRLEALLGHIDVEQILGEIFSSFCVGK